MKNFYVDEKTQHVFNGLIKDLDLDVSSIDLYFSLDQSFDLITSLLKSDYEPIFVNNLNYSEVYYSLELLYQENIDIDLYNEISLHSEAPLLRILLFYYSFFIVFLLFYNN